MADLEPIFDKKFVCPMCNKSFTSKKVRSRFVKIANYDSDFAPIYSSNDSNPLFYFIQVCPSCGFSFSEEFSNFFPTDSKDAIQTNVSNRWIPQDFGSNRTCQQAIQTYKLAVYCGLLKKEKHILMAGLYIRTAWLYRSIENTEQEQRFMKLALNEYEQSYFADDFRNTQISEIKLFYLMGELSRRLNDKEKAMQYFSKVIEKQRQSVEPKIVEMAKERWHEMRHN